MEVAIGGNTPFRREVREWQRVDPNTGALLTGRVESDRWINGPLNTYGKVSLIFIIIVCTSLPFFPFLFHLLANHYIARSAKQICMYETIRVNCFFSYLNKIKANNCCV